TLVAERAATQVHDERVVAKNVAKAMLGRPHAIVVFLSVAQPEHGIERTDLVDQYASDVKAKPDAGGKIGIDGRSGPLEGLGDLLDIAFAGPRIVLAKAWERTDFGIVGKRRDRSYHRVRFGTAYEFVEPTLGDDRVGVEQHHVGVAPRQLHPPIC